jgi:adenylate cyclase
MDDQNLGRELEADGRTAVRFSAVLAWLQSEAVRHKDTGRFLEEFADRLLQAGVALFRVTIGIHIIHPQIDASRTLWQKGKPVTERRWKMDRRVVQNSPMATIYGGRIFRVRLDGPPQPREFPILAELRAEGVTEYLGLPLPFSDGSWKAITFSTCAPGGFSDEQFAMLRSLEPNLARILEIQTLHRTTLTLLNTYVGPIAGGRVLDGAIKRGMCEAIRAVIWFCDLRDFTELSEKLPAVELVNLLNDYFGAMTDAVGRHGGEVLKFIGDALLAIFPLTGANDTLIADRAMAGAQEAAAAIDAMSEKRRAIGQPEIRFGLALHVGEVLYGNIGGDSRLDFTVIGKAVNVASRVEALTKSLGKKILFSGEFAYLCSTKGRLLGVYPLPGVEGSLPVHSLDI